MNDYFKSNLQVTSDNIFFREGLKVENEVDVLTCRGNVFQVFAPK